MDLEDFVHRCEDAWQVFVTGDPGPAMLLFSHRDDVTLANPWGPAMTGWAHVSKDAGRFALRVTSTYRHEDGQWRIVLRHADPIVAQRPADATLGG
jgi:hypothetical protein